MDPQEQEKERLLGYLLNALDDQESAQVRQELSRNPQLRAELATLQRELAPLNYMDVSVEPPPELAKRTCAKIWAALDKEENLSDAKLDSQLDSAASQDSVLGTIVDPFKTLLNIPSVSAKSAIVMENKSETPAKPKSQKPASFLAAHWMGLTVSALVGIAVAFFLFPMIRYAERSTRSFIADNWMTEINRRVDQYEQIYSNPSIVPQVEAILPFNLALNGWQELYPETFSAAPFMQPIPTRSFEEVIALIRKESLTGQKANDITQEYSSPLFSFFEGIDEPIPLEIGGFSDSLLLSIPESHYPVRSAFGQTILLKEGRVFFRTFPSADPPKQ